MRKRAKILAALFLVLSFCLTGIGQTKEVEAFDILYPISDKNENWGYIDGNGNIVVLPQFIGARDFNDGVGVIYTHKGDGFVDAKGKVTIFNGVKLLTPRFFENLAIGHSKGITGFIDKMGNTVTRLPNNLAESFGFSEGFVQMAIKNKLYFINNQGQIVIAQGFDDIPLGFVQGMATVVVDGKWAVINRNGEYIVKPQDKYISNFSDGLINIGSDDENIWIYVDRNGKAVLEVRYSYAGDFVEGLAKVEVDDKWGYIDQTGKLVIAPQFDEAQDFSDGLAAVKFNDNLGFISKKGEFIIRPVFDYMAIDTRFNRGLVYVYKGKVEGYINKRGDWVWKKQRY